MTNYWVSTTGSDSTGTGSFASPWLTIGKGDTGFVGPGDIIWVLPGTYLTPGNLISTTTNGTALNHIRYISTINKGAIVRTNNVGGSALGRCWQNTGNYIDVIGFEITSSDTAARIGIIHGGSNCLTQWCYIHDLQAVGQNPNGGAAINESLTSVGNQAISNIVHHIGTAASDTTGNVHGIYAAGTGLVAQNNISHHNSGWGIHSWHNASALTICNNLVFENGIHLQSGGGIVIGADPATGTTNDNTKCHNNIALNNHGNNGAISEVGTTGLNNTYKNNLVFGNEANSGTGNMISLLNGLTATGTLTSDPQLVNYQGDGSGDYRLKVTSPAVDAGVALGAPLYDLLGVNRPQGSGYDIGPYEYVPVQANARGGLSLIGA